MHRFWVSLCQFCIHAVAVAAPPLEQVSWGTRAHLSLFEGFAIVGLTSRAGGPLGRRLQYPILQVQLLRWGSGCCPVGGPREEEHKGALGHLPEENGLPGSGPSALSANPRRAGGGRGAG